AARLPRHSTGNKPLAANAVGHRPRGHLQQTPHAWVYGFDDTDALDPEPECREEERIQAPRHAVVEIVHEPGLARREQACVADAGQEEHVAERRWTRRSRGACARLEPHVTERLPNEEQGKTEAEHRNDDAQVKRL